MEGSPKPSETRTTNRGSLINHALLAQQVELMQKELGEAREREHKMKTSYFDLLNKYHLLSDKDSTSLTLQQLLKQHKLGLDMIAGPSDHKFRDNYSNSLERSVNTEISDFAVPRMTGGSPVQQKYYRRDDHMRSSRSVVNCKRALGSNSGVEDERKSYKREDSDNFKNDLSRLRYPESRPELLRLPRRGESGFSNQHNQRDTVDSDFGTAKTPLLHKLQQNIGNSQASRAAIGKTPSDLFGADQIPRMTADQAHISPGSKRMPMVGTDNHQERGLYTPNGPFSSKIGEHFTEPAKGLSVFQPRTQANYLAIREPSIGRDSSTESRGKHINHAMFDSRKGSIYDTAKPTEVKTKIGTKAELGQQTSLTNLSSRLNYRAALQQDLALNSTPNKRLAALAPSSAFSKQGNDKENSALFRPGLKLGVEINKQGSPLARCYDSASKSRCGDFSNKNTPSIKIDLTPNNDSLEGIEIDSSVPDKCFIKFIKSNPRTTEFQSQGMREGLRRPLEQGFNFQGQASPRYSPRGQAGSQMASLAANSYMNSQLLLFQSSKNLKIDPTVPSSSSKLQRTLPQQEASAFSLYAPQSLSQTAPSTPTGRSTPTPTRGHHPDASLSLAGLEHTQQYLLSRFHTIADIYDAAKPSRPS